MLRSRRRDRYRAGKPAPGTPATIWIATNGNDGTGDGTEGAPYKSIQQAINYSAAGDTIIVKHGIYLPTGLIDVYSGKDNLKIKAAPGARPVFSAINYATPSTYNDRVIRLTDVTGVSISGIGFTDGPDGGMQINGACSAIRISNCSFFRNGRRSVSEGQGVVVSGTSSDVIFTNCDSYENFDALGTPVGSNADGFQFSSTGSGNYAYFCRAWNNSDDGFDCYNTAAAASGITIAPVTLYGCSAWRNGYLADNVSESLGDGNGFKLGGQDTGNGSGGNIAINCFAWQNREIGFTDNSCTIANKMYNCTAYDNDRINIEAGALAHTIINCIALQADESNVSIANTTNVRTNSWTIGTFTAAEWANIDPATAVLARGPNGALPLTSFLELNPTSSYYIAGETVPGFYWPEALLPIGAIRDGDSARSAWEFSGATLDLDFVNDRSYNDGTYGDGTDFLTVTRASVGYAPDSAGVYRAFASNSARRTDLGLLVEEARTNSIRNNSMQGAVAGTPGTPPTNWFIGGAAGLTVQLVGTGTENGVDYIDYRFSGTTGGTFATINFEAVGIIAGSNGQTWAHSLFLKRVAGSVTNISGIDNTLQTYTSGSVFLANYTSSVLSSINTTLTRYSAASTVVDATTAFVRSTLLLSYGSGVAIDITLRIGWPQLELGAFATSPIRTTSAAATRAADAISVPAVSSGSRTIFAEGVPTATDAFATAQIIAQLDDGSANERMLLFRISGNPSGTVVIGASSTDYNAIDFGTHSQGANGKYALALETGAQSGVFNGGAISAGTKAGLPAASTTLRVGTNTAGAGQWNGYLRRVAYFPTRLTNAQLQALTT